MFGLSQQEKDDKIIAKGVEQGLDIIMRQFNEAVYTTAEALDSLSSIKGDHFKQDRYLAVIYALAISIATDAEASKGVAEKGLKTYFSAFPDGVELYRRTVQGNLYSVHGKLMRSVSSFYNLVLSGQGDREVLLMSLAQVYLESPKFGG